MVGIAFTTERSRLRLLGEGNLGVRGLITGRRQLLAAASKHAEDPAVLGIDHTNQEVGH